MLYQDTAAQGLRRASPAVRSAAALADCWSGLPDGVTRWRLAAALRAAAKPLGLSASMLRLLEHYIDLSYDCDWFADSEPVICRPTVEIADALGLGERQVRNLERRLAEAGLLAFRDSGNHHRKGRRDRRTGRLSYAYGPSLAPLGVRAAEIITLAGIARGRIAEARKLRLALSALRRRIRTDLAEAAERGVAMDDLGRAFDATPSRTSAGLDLATLEAQRSALLELAAQAAQRLDTPQLEHTPECAGEPAIFSRHNTDTCIKHSMNGYATTKSNMCSTPLKHINSTGSQNRPRSISLDLAIAAAGDGIAAAMACDPHPSWAHLIDAAGRTAPALGIDQTLWGQACTTLGRDGAALAAIVVENGLVRPCDSPIAPIRAPAAYLRAMLARASSGSLHLDRSIRALASRNHDRSRMKNTQTNPSAQWLSRPVMPPSFPKKGGDISLSKASIQRP